MSVHTSSFQLPAVFVSALQLIELQRVPSKQQIDKKKVLVDSWPSDKNKILKTVQSCTPNHAPNKIYAKIKFIVAFFLGILWRGEELLNIWLILQLH